MIHDVAEKDWHVDLCDKIDIAENGDVIKCRTPEMKELGERALQRMCPDKKLTFAVEG